MFTTKFFKRCILLLLFLVILSNCSNSTTPNEPNQLILSDGYYSILGTKAGLLECLIEFKYEVKGSSCHIGGYAIEWNKEENNVAIVDWFLSEKIKTNKVYAVSDTFRLSHLTLVSPTVTMQGYLDNCTVEYPELEDSIELQKRE